MRNEGAKRTAVAAKVPGWVAAWARQEAATRGVTVSEFVARLIEDAALLAVASVVEAATAVDQAEVTR